VAAREGETKNTRISGKKGGQAWELISPEGVVQVEAMSLNPHPSDFAEKNVLLRWNGKHNGDLFLNRIAECLEDRVMGIRVIKAWEVAPDTVVAISGSQERSVSLAKRLAAFKPDIAIGAYGD
jgi:hypothetical protein